MVSLVPQQGQARAFGWIVDGARVLDDLEEKAKDTRRPEAERHDDRMRVEGARMVMTVMEQAAAAGLPQRG